MALYNYGIGGNEVKVDPNESIAEIPSNRTLIVQKLTDEAPAAPESVYGLETIGDVFQRFEPTVDLQHVDAEGNEVKEVMTFKDLGDFGAKKIKENSDFLSKLDIEKEQGVRITRQLTSNRALQKALENPEVKNAMMEVIEASIAEILANQKKRNFNLFTKMKQETQQQTANTTSQKAVSQVQKSSAAAIDRLKEYGGFAFLENIIDGFSNLNPARKARRNIFLTDEQWENERKALVNRLNVWLKLLRENDTAEQMRDKAKETAERAESLLNSNLKNALARTRELETAYRTIAFFYKNTESDKVKNVTIVNATMEQLQDLDNTIFADHISNELKQNFDRLDLRRNYSLLVVPGYIGSNAILDKWSKMAYENKAFLITDFQDLETPDDVVDIFFNANHTGGDAFKSNTIMTCNWLLGRQKEDSVGEEENLYIPPSSSLAGKIYNTLMSQVVAGKKFGGLNEVESVRFDLRKSEISELERMGLVPMVNEYSKVMAFSAKTLFNGDNLGLQTYSVVRVFDYITKVLIDFLNRRAFENWTTRTEADLRSQVVKFLDSVMGPNKLIERFKVMKIEQDPNQKDRVLLDIHITPYFPAKSFVIQLAGHKGDGPEDAIWESEYHQE